MRLKEDNKTIDTMENTLILLREKSANQAEEVHRLRKIIYTIKNRENLKPWSIGELIVEILNRFKFWVEK